MRKFGMLVLALSLVVVTQSAFSQQNPDYHLRFSAGATGDAGGTAEVMNFIDTGNGIGVAGWSWGVCQSPNVAISSVVDGPATIAITPAFNAPNIIADGWTVGVVVDFGGMVSLPAADGNELHVSTYDLLADGVATISYCDTIGSPVVDTVLVLSDGSSAVPTREDGFITVGGVVAGPPTMSAGSATDIFGGTSTTVAVTLDSETDIEGFSFGVVHDGALADVTAVEQGVTVAATNGGGGPSFFGPNIAPIGGVGYTVGCVISFSAADVIAAGTGSELALATYAIDSSAPDPSSTALTIVDGMGDPPVTLAVVVDTASVVPDVVAGSIGIINPPADLFRRGDANQDGQIDVADAVTIAEALFMVGAPIDCDDTADTDDNGLLEPTQDTLYLLNFLFLSGPAVPAPYPNCGPDGTGDAIDCGMYDAC